MLRVNLVFTDFTFDKKLCSEKCVLDYRIEHRTQC